MNPALHDQHSSDLIIHACHPIASFLVLYLASVLLHDHVNLCRSTTERPGKAPGWSAGLSSTFGTSLVLSHAEQVRDPLQQVLQSRSLRQRSGWEGRRVAARGVATGQGSW